MSERILLGLETVVPGLEAGGGMRGKPEGRAEGEQDGVGIFVRSAIFLSEGPWPRGKRDTLLPGSFVLGLASGVVFFLELNLDVEGTTLLVFGLGGTISLPMTIFFSFPVFLVKVSLLW